MRLVKQLIKQTLASSWGWRGFSRLGWSGSTLVLMYHRVVKPGDLFEGLEVSVFRQQMQWLKDRCHVLSPRDTLEHAGRPGTGKPWAVITFDDGYRDYHDNAYPVLQELGLPAVVFLATSFMDHGGLIWTDTVNWAAARSRVERVTLPWDFTQTVTLDEVDGRRRLTLLAKRFLKDIPDTDRAHWLDRLIETLEVEKEPIGLDRQMMTWDEVRRVLPGTDIGGHTHTHPILSQVDVPTMEQEIRLCRDRIRDETGAPPTLFAYPNGRSVDFNRETKRLLNEYGFNLAFTTEEGVNGRATDPLEIRRLPTGARTTADLAWMLARGRA